jgi:hypothetical protein
MTDQNHVATDGQSISMPWCLAPSGANDQVLVTVTKLQFSQCEAPFLTGLSFVNDSSKMALVDIYIIFRV